MSRVVAIVGPTATGKSDLGVDLALALGGEVVNADSMQLYAAWTSAPPSSPSRSARGVPHHLLDVWPVTRTATVAEYQVLCRGVVDDLLARGVTPVLVGGSGLYLRAALDDLRFPGTDPALRSRLEDELEREGPYALHARLAALDPAAAARMEPGNGRRVVRALEVVELTGSMPGALTSYDAVYDVVQVGLDVPDLDERVAQRVDRMWAGGLLEEVAGLAERGLREGVTASRALGYAQVLAAARRRPDRRAGAGGDGRRHAAVRAAAAGVVPARPAHHLAGARRHRARPGAAASLRCVRYLKGHGTENDFVVLPDLDDRLDLTPELVARLCDRRAGIGGDGVLRVVRAHADPAEARWFMDYRNADGSLAEMCGNGVRVYARYLVDAGHEAPGALSLATRGGVKQVEVGPDVVVVDMGPAVVGAPVLVDGVEATSVDMGNPHAVLPVDSVAALGVLDPDRKDLNVEYLEQVGSRHLRMRVHERGVGETRSCGTGACALVVAQVLRSGEGRGEPYDVDVPGGRLVVTWREDGHVLLSGPAVLVAEGDVRDDWLEGR